MEQFGQWLLQNRTRAELTQQELAENVTRSGVKCSKSYICTLEKGGTNPISGERVRPSKALVDGLADALNAGRAGARLAAGYAPKDPDPDLDFGQEIAALARRVPVQRRELFKRKMRTDGASLASVLAEL